MKKEHKTYILLAAVLGIWGIIAYQFFEKLNPSTEEIEITKFNAKFIPKEVEVSTFYEVQGVDRDPFLGKFVKKKVVIKKKKKTSPKPTTPFPNVIYNGIVKGKTSESYILTIKGKQKIVKKGQVEQGVKLIKADSKKAIVSFEGIRKTVLSKQVSIGSFKSQ